MSTTKSGVPTSEFLTAHTILFVPLHFSVKKWTKSFNFYAIHSPMYVRPRMRQWKVSVSTHSPLAQVTHVDNVSMKTNSIRVCKAIEATCAQKRVRISYTCWHTNYYAPIILSSMIHQQVNQGEYLSSMRSSIDKQTKSYITPTYVMGCMRTVGGQDGLYNI